MKSLRSRAPLASSKLTRRVMQANVGRETAAERLVRSYLHRAGFRFRKDARPVRKLRCAADLVFRRHKICIFVDGCFWHRCPRCYRPPKSNQDYWLPKIARNCERDRQTNRSLRRMNWRVIRFWECSLKREAAVVRRLTKALSPTTPF